jgi:Tol biopolymer transport system component
VQLTNFADSVTSPALSADGRMLTFIRGSSSFVGAGQIWVKFLPDGEPKQITRDDLQKMSPVFSLDGSRVVYTAVEQSGWNTREVPVLGGEPKLVLPNAAGLVWQINNKVLFSEIIRGGDGNHMKIVEAEDRRAGARDVYVPTPKGAMAHRSYPSPDGKWVLVAEMDERGTWLPCRLLAMDGSSAGKAVGPSGAACWFSAWSPDGKWTYFNSSVDGGFHIWRQRFSQDGRLAEPEQITSGATEEEGIAMSPDGRSFITAVGLKQGSVWLRGPKGDRQVSLEGVARQPRFTPDGNRLLYVVGTSGSPERRELWVAELNSGRAEALLPGFSVGGDDVRQPFDVSSDSRTVALEARDQKGERGLWLAPLDRRTSPCRISDLQGDGPLFGPDGEIYFRAREADYGFAYRVREDGSGLRKVSTQPVHSTVSVSPDGHLIVNARTGEHETGRTLALPLRGGPPVPIYGRFMALKWSPDGKLLFLSVPRTFYSGQSGNTYVLPLRPGRALPQVPAGGFPSEESVARMPGVRVIDSPDVALGPTRDVFAFSRVTVQRNLYRIRVP